MRIAVVGDIMIDIDHHCSVSRIAQEGPWPVYKIERTERRLGGAGNVAVMCDALGADVMLCGSVNQSEATQPNRSGAAKLLITACHIERTTTKTRLIVDGRYAGLRLDDEECQPPREGYAEWLVENIRTFGPDAIIVADHGKGVVTRELMDRLQTFDCSIYVDSVATTPMIDGTIIVCGEHEAPVERHTPVGGIVKYGPKGLTYWHTTESMSQAGTFPSVCAAAVDALGAGDQLIATLAVLRCHAVPWAKAVEVANKAAGIQCTRMGCVPVTPDEINLGAFQSFYGELPPKADVTRKPRAAVFLDRDGTIIVDQGYAGRPEGVELMPHAGEAIARLNAAGIPVVVVTNQSGVSLGKITREDVDAVNRSMDELLSRYGAKIDRYEICESRDCRDRRRKPNPGMIQDAADAMNLDPTLSVMIGDKPSDMTAGRLAGCDTLLIKFKSFGDIPDLMRWATLGAFHSLDAAVEVAMDAIRVKLGAEP